MRAMYLSASAVAVSTWSDISSARPSSAQPSTFFRYECVWDWLLYTEQQWHVTINLTHTHTWRNHQDQLIHVTVMTGKNQSHTLTWRNASVLRRRTTEFCCQTTTNIWTHAWYDCAPTQHPQPCHRPVTGIKCRATLCRILVKGQKSFEHSLLWCRNMINKARTGLPVDSSLWGKLCMTNMEHPKFEGHVMPNEDKY